MILKKQPICLVEVLEIVKDQEGKEDLVKHLKKFAHLNKEKAHTLLKKLREVHNPKLKEENLVKILDFVPEDQEDLNKIVSEAHLTEEEAKVLLEVVAAKAP